MKHLTLFSAALLVASAMACADDGGEPSDPNDVPTEGGSVTIESCGWDLTTRVGASEPQPGSQVLGDDPRPRHVHLGLAGDPSTSIVMQWRTHDENTLATTVRYGKDGNLDQTADGYTFVFVGGFNQNGEVVRMHETHICGLEPDTEYSYQVGGSGADGTEAWSDTYTFRTAPTEDTSDEVVILNMGDSRDGYDVLAELVELGLEQRPDLVLFSGDAVTIGQVQLEWETFFDVGEPLFATAPLLQAHGNHDVNAVNFYSQHAMPGDEENYSLDYGPVHVTVVNDTPLEQGDIRGATAEFLDSDLAANEDRPWKLLVQHRSLWSASTRHGSDELLQEAWGPIIDRYHVDMVLGGHDHNYERTKPMRGTGTDSPEVAPSPAEGTIYVVSGGAGAGLYDNGSDFWTETSAKEHNLVLIRASSTMLEYEAWREDGTLLDSLTIAK